MPGFSFEFAKSITRSGLVLAIVGAAAIGLLHGRVNVDAQDGSTPSSVAAATTIGKTPVATPAATVTAAAFSSGQAVVVNADSLHLRAGASIDAAVDATLANGTWAVIVDGPVDSGDGHAWWRIDVDDVTGWVDGDYLIDAASAAAALPVGAVAMATTDGLNLRAEPTLTADVVSQLSNGDTATVVGAGQTADAAVWIQLDFNGVTGWAVRNYLALAPVNDATATAGGITAVN